MVPLIFNTRPLLFNSHGLFANTLGVIYFSFGENIFSSAKKYFSSGVLPSDLVFDGLTRLDPRLFSPFAAMLPPCCHAPKRLYINVFRKIRGSMAAKLRKKIVFQLIARTIINGTLFSNNLPSLFDRLRQTDIMF